MDCELRAWVLTWNPQLETRNNYSKKQLLSNSAR